MKIYEEKNLKFSKKAESKGLQITGPGRNSSYRTYKFHECKHEQDINVGMVRRSNFKCQKCFYNKISEDAKVFDLLLISKRPRKQKYLFKFNKCNHFTTLPLKHMRTGDFHCRKCQEKKLRLEASRIGLDLIGKNSKHGYRLYRFKKCNHEKSISSSQIRQGTARCQICFEDKLHSEASNVNLNYLGASTDGNSQKRSYLFKTCRHEQNIATKNVRIGVFKCNQCYDDEIDNILIENDIELISKGKKSKNIYKFRSCQHQETIRLDRIRAGNLACNTCKPLDLRDDKSRIFNAGLEYISEGRTQGYGKFRILDCGHEKEIYWSHLEEYKLQMSNLYRRYFQ